MAKAPHREELDPVLRSRSREIAPLAHEPIRLTCADDERLVELARQDPAAWRGYTDENCFVYAQTEGEPHNTITPIAGMRDGKFQLDLVLRNNITDGREHPLGESPCQTPSHQKGEHRPHPK